MVVPGCPNEGRAAVVLGQALADVGLADVPVRTVVVVSQRQAEQLGFVGSPTILVNGVDPFGTEGQAPGLACRVYRGAAGLSGVPDPDALRRALRQAARSRSGPG